MPKYTMLITFQTGAPVLKKTLRQWVDNRLIAPATLDGLKGTVVDLKSVKINRVDED